MTRSHKYWEWWELGPTSKPSVLCPLMGTNFCRDYCPEWDNVATNCSLSRCRCCKNQVYCQCTVDKLPRPITLNIHLDLPPPNGETLFLAHATGKCSLYCPASQWLLCDPRWHAEQTIAYFTEHYGSYPHYHLYATSLGILIAGPIPAVGL
jgi:hypothetical protein